MTYKSVDKEKIVTYKSVDNEKLRLLCSVCTHTCIQKQTKLIQNRICWPQIPIRSARKAIFPLLVHYVF